MPNYTVNASKVNMLADYIKYLGGTGRVQFTTLDRSVTTTGNGAAASSSTNASPSSDVASAYAGIVGGLNGGLVEPGGLRGCWSDYRCVTCLHIRSSTKKE